MQIDSLCTGGIATDSTLERVAARLTDRCRQANAVVALYDCAHPAPALRSFLAETFPGAAVIGGSSNGGVIDGTGAYGSGAVGLWMLTDAAGNFGAASADKGDDPAGAAEAALRRAIARSGCAGDLPDLVYVLLSPGAEERVLDGFRRVVGDRCPIVGGSTADNDLSGSWTQLGPDGTHRDGFAVIAFFTDHMPEVHFRGGYEPLGRAGRVTAVAAAPDAEPDGRAGRVLLEIDGRPAAEVYDAWIGGAITHKIETGGSVLSETSLHPLGIETGLLGGVTQYLLVHPEKALPGGALTTFADVAPGTLVHCMTGSRQLLIDRAGTVTRQARALLPTRDGPAGALVTYCGGCRLAVGDAWPEIGPAISGALSGAPFLAGFTFGEQGPSGGRNAHGNLMISAIVFP